jgi:hypothetical protein
MGKRPICAFAIMDMPEMGEHVNVKFQFGQFIKFILSLIKAIVQKADEAAESLLIGRGMAIIKRGMVAKSNEIGGKQVKEGFVLST